MRGLKRLAIVLAIPILSLIGMCLLHAYPATFGCRWQPDWLGAWLLSILFLVSGGFIAAIVFGAAVFGGAMILSGAFHIVDWALSGFKDDIDTKTRKLANKVIREQVEGSLSQTSGSGGEVSISDHQGRLSK